MRKCVFTEEEIENIIKYYNDGLSCHKIGKYYSVSKNPINRILKENGNSNGKKIILTKQQEIKIKEMYFSKKNNLIEIKSDYTYDVLIGKKISRFSNKFDTNQYRKIKWVNENVKPVEILVIDKRNNNIIKKEIL